MAAGRRSMREWPARTTAIASRAQDSCGRSGRVPSVPKWTGAPDPPISSRLRLPRKRMTVRAICSKGHRRPRLREFLQADQSRSSTLHRPRRWSSAAREAPPDGTSRSHQVCRAATGKHALQRKLLDGLRYLLKEELKLNQAQASDGWLTQDSLWLVSKTVSDKLRAHLLAQGIEGIPANNTAVFNVLQDHGLLQPATNGKTIWRATVTSDVGWSHTLTLLRLAPALIWEGDDRPEPFTGTVEIEVERNDAATESSIDSGETSPVAAAAPAPSAAPAADSVDALQALLGTSDTEPPPQRAEIKAPPETSTNGPPATSQANDAMLAPAAAPLSTKNSGNTREQPSGEHFMAWLRNHVQSRKLIINDAKALVHTVADTAFWLAPVCFSATHRSTRTRPRSPSRIRLQVGRGCKSASKSCNCTASRSMV